MKLLLAGGGTGGHVTPAIAIAQAMQKRDENLDVAFVGRESGEENKAITSKGYKLYTINVKGLSRKFSKESLKSLYLAVRSLKEAREIIKSFSPDVILATGGYVSWPIVKEGIKARIPTLMHESNVYPGLVTRMLGKKANALLLNTDKTLVHLKHTDNCIVTGNPLREDFFQKSKSEARASLGINPCELFIVSFGGSLGSEVLNKTVISVMKSYSSKAPNVRHLHSAGTRYYDEIKKTNESLIGKNQRCRIVPYIDNMPTVLTAADIVVCRSGAMTLTEIAKTGVASILIPSPNVADDHQRKNAEALKKSKSALMITEDELSPRLLERKIIELKNNAEKRGELSENIKKMYVADSADKICKVIEKFSVKNMRLP